MSKINEMTGEQCEQYAESIKNKIIEDLKLNEETDDFSIVIHINQRVPEGIKEFGVTYGLRLMLHDAFTSLFSRLSELNNK